MNLVAEGLGRRIPERWLFRELSLQVSAGQTLAVRGPSGSGKTSLLRALAWLDPVEEGAVRLGDDSPASLGAPSWRARVSYVAQQAPALAGSPADATRDIAALAAQRERAADDPRALAEAWGLAPALFDKSWSQLSGGEQQRAWLAIVVARRPDVLLLDEPTSALDADARLAVEASLRERTCVWVTHDDEQASRVADDTVELGS
jgi:ABC-type iron transport system FetAB ATPase subunit